jgi:Helix-turn-helix domain
MEYAGNLFRERLDRIVVENEMLRAGFAAFPYVVLRDTRLSVGARLAYAVLLSYAWQEGSCFPGQLRMAKDMGITDRHLRRFLVELREVGYVVWRKTMPWGTNTYVLVDVKSKLKAKRTRASGTTGHRRPASKDIRVRKIDPVIKTQ